LAKSRELAQSFPALISINVSGGPGVNIELVIEFNSQQEQSEHAHAPFF
jgi:hypothetical protein